MRAACVIVLLASCGHRVSEPDKTSLARASSTSTAAPATAATTGGRGRASDASTAAASASAARCIVPTPPAPVRPPPPAGPDPRCPVDPTGPFPLRHATVRVAGVDASLDVEVAEHDEHRTRGLMFRKSLGESQGMLFVFNAERDLAFWMRNTCLALDMIFAASDGTIVGIEENVPTLNDGHYAPGDCPARYVVEVNAGWARRHGVKAGQKLIFGGL
ncbi:MAG: DUF192 domain-containing protein [Deltaproteobacteria bacterium]|nr:DUF192 domain-containing protein [Deltaproteobacteria bacterium]